MKKKFWKKGYLVSAVILALLIVGISIPSIYAAPGIEVGRSSSLTLSVADTGEYAADLTDATINANIYRVASVAENGTYTSVAPFEALAIEDISSGQENWDAIAAQAVTMLEGASAAAQIQITGGTGTATNLETGMYLVVVDPASTELYQYTFSPYLIALPDNLYYQSGNVADDAWIYDVQAGLKPEQQPRYGSLSITKTLTEYNETLQDVTFVFQIEGVDTDGNVVYSNVVSTNHTSAGSEVVVVDHIPAGASVTVTEVYSGASYEMTAAPDSAVTIPADGMVGVEFTNTYNDRLTPSYGVTNHFEHDEDEGWQWTQLNGNNATQQ